MDLLKDMLGLSTDKCGVSVEGDKRKPERDCLEIVIGDSSSGSGNNELPTTQNGLRVVLAVSLVLGEFCHTKRITYRISKLVRQYI